MWYGVAVVEHLRLVLWLSWLLVKLRLLSLLCIDSPRVTYKRIHIRGYVRGNLLYTHIFNYIDIYEVGKWRKTLRLHAKYDWGDSVRMHDG